MLVPWFVPRTLRDSGWDAMFDSLKLWQRTKDASDFGKTANSRKIWHATVTADTFDE